MSKMKKKIRKNKKIYLRRSSPVFIDTGPLMLLLVGTYNVELIHRIKRVRKYDHLHYEMLTQFLSGRRIFITPGVLAEVSNLVKKGTDKKFKEFIDANISGLKEMGEIYIEKNSIINTNEFIKFGYTDSTLFKGAEENNGDIITDDSKFWHFCNNKKIKTIHIEYLKERATIFN